MRYILALDQGTTSSRAILYDERGGELASAQREFKQIYPREAWVEHDPWDIWQTQIGVAREVLELTGISPRDLAGIGITNQRETTLMWDRKTGQPLYNAIVWQCRRSASYVEKLREEGYFELIRKKTGLLPDAYFSATKILWLLDRVEGLRERCERGEVAFGTVDSWLMWNLTRGELHVTDVTNASRTMLYDIEKLAWDSELLELMDIPPSILPEVRDSSGIFGWTHREVLGGVRVPISGVAGDQQAALFGQLCFKEGMIKNTYGTGCFMLMNTGNRVISSNKGLLSTIAWKIGEEVVYALEGSIFTGGAAVQWLRDELRIIPDAASSERLALEAGESGVIVVPAFTGLGAPHWDMYARGTIFGLTRGSNRGHLVRATLESIALQSRDVLKTMEEESGIELRSLMVDGGASANNFLMQFQADILDLEIERPENLESTALGAAFLAGLGSGLWKDKEELRSLKKEDRTFGPLEDKAWREEKLKLWRRALDRSLGWIEK